MAIKDAPLAIYQGDDWAAMVTVTNPDFTAADLTGYTAQAQIRTGPADQNPYVAAEMLTAVVTPNLISLSLTHAQTVLLDDAINYFWDLQITSGTNPPEITTLLTGAVTVTAEVTREATV